MIKKFLSLSLVLCILMSILLAYTTNAASSLSITMGNDFTIEDGGTNIRQFPNVSAVNDDDCFVGFTQTPDELSDDPSSSAAKISRDGGATWTERIEKVDFPPINILELANGNLVGITFTHQRTDDTHGYFYLWTSTDNGVNWTKSTANMTYQFAQFYNTGAPDRGGFQNTVMYLWPDGSYRALMYGKYSGDTYFRSFLIKSTDGGANWSQVSEIAYYPNVGSEGYCESAIARCTDNSLLCVMRTGSGFPLHQSRSTDDGLTWSIPTTLPGIDPSLTESVLPQLILMSNGTLALSYGRPLSSMLFASDGCGYKWEYYSPSYSTITSGNTGLAEVESNKLMLVGDRGANWANPTDYEIWGKYIDVVKNTVSGERIDLKTKYLRGEMTVSTDMTWSDATNHPETGIAGAFDMNTAYWNTALKSTTTVPGYYTISLDKIYSMTALGICLKPGYSESADIYFSTDGINWGSSVKSYSGVNQTIVNYTTFATPVQARYVKVNVTNASGGAVALNEIELYYNPDTYESDEVGAVPAGYTLTAGMANVSSTVAYAGTKSLRITDVSSSALTSIKKTTTASKGKILEFKYYPVASPNGSLFDILSGSIVIYHLCVTSDGCLKWWDGSTWNLITQAGKVSFNVWNTIKIDAGSARAKIYLNDKFAGLAGRLNKTYNTFDSFSLNSGSTVLTGDDFYVDNVTFDVSYNSDEDTFETDTVGGTPTGLGYKYYYNGSTVSNTRAYEGSRSLRVYDSSTGYISGIKKFANPSTTKVLEFRVYPVAAPNGIIFILMGGGTEAIYQMSILSTGTLNYFNGSSWVALSGAGNVTFNQWNKITVMADMTNAKVYLNGTLAGIALTQGTAVSKVMDTVQFSTSSASGTGDDYYFDNVYFQRGYDNDLDTFEKYAAGAAPTEYTNNLATVSTTYAKEGTKSLRIYDTSTTAQASADKVGNPSGTKVTEFDIYPVAAPSGNVFDLVGNGSIIYHFGIFSNGNLKYYNGSTWTVLSGAGSVSFNQWSKIRMEANMFNTKIYVNGTYAGTASRLNNTKKAIDGIRFTSGSAPGTGDDFYVDNVFNRYEQ